MTSKRKETIQEICINGLIAALYVAFTVALAPVSYGPVQFRFSEVLVLMCFFNKKYSVGLTLGCLIANIFSPTAVLDIPFGTLATLIACIGIMFSKHLAIALVFPVVVNAFIIAGELSLFGEPFWFSVLTIAAGELIVMIVGYVTVMITRSPSFYKVIKANQNTEFKF